MRIRKAICILLALTMLLSLAACGGGAASSGDASSDPAGTGATATLGLGGDPVAYLTDGNGMFIQAPEGFFKVYSVSELDKSSGKIIEIDPTKTYQTIDGFGASITDTAAIVMSQMPKEQLDEAYLRLFDDEQGIGLSYIRNCLGSSDFAPEYYTYNDLPQGEEDYNLEKFDFSHDLKQIVPLTKKAMEINPDIKVILSPWSPPLWMRTTWAWNKADNRLRRECYGVYADYLVKSIKSYQDAGVNVFAFTAQNEQFASTPWPSMIWNWEVMSNWINDYLGPRLDDAGLGDVMLLAGDHNFGYRSEIESIMAGSMEYVDGAAYHWYEGEPEEMITTYENFPDKYMMVTEASSSRGAPRTMVTNIANDVIRGLRSGASGWINWNLALDHNGGPTYNDINIHCSALITCNTETKTITYDPDYFALAHFSKFMQDGAVRVDSTDTGVDTEYNLVNVAALNKNGSMAAVFTNKSRKNAELCKVVIGDKVIEFTMDTRTALTLAWDGNL